MLKNRKENDDNSARKRRRLVDSSSQRVPMALDNNSKKVMNIRDGKKREKKKHLVTRKRVIGRSHVALLLVMAIFVVIVFQLVLLQLIDAKNYKNAALNQYVREVTINPKRGNIYDRNMRALALNATVEDVCLSPYHIKAVNQTDENGSQTEGNVINESEDVIIQKIVDEMYEVLGVDKAELKKKISSGMDSASKYLLVKKAVEKEKTSLIREFVAANNYTNLVYFQENTKRYYPLGSLASHVIGVSGVDGGLTGLELKYNKDLSGTKGKVISGKDGTGKDLSFKYESIIDAEDGYNLVTTIDYNVQGILEKYLKEAFEDNNAANRVAGIIMDVNTGEIYADAVYPDYDLNNPFELSEYYQNIFDEYKVRNGEGETYGMRLLDNAWFEFCHENGVYVPEKNTEENFRTCLLNTMWNNKTVTEPYEPGSTFKIVTAAVALEEGFVSESSSYVCSRDGITVDGIRINCHQARGHGLQNFAETLQNSCNPAFVTWGQKIGQETFLDYFEEFGFVGNTGSDFVGERSTLYYKSTGATFGNLGLATYSFGQTFKTTMLQQIRAVSVVANGGKLVVPHLAKSLVDDEGNVVKTYDYSAERSVISEDVSDTIVRILKEGAKMGTTKNATVSGYEVAAKTGTSQKRDITNEEKYISSCVAFAPAGDPQIAILIVVDEPTGNDFYGGLVAAPVVSKVLTEALPALGIKATGEKTVITTPIEDYRGASISIAQENIARLGLNCKIVGTGNSVVSQMPVGGTQMITGGTVVLHTDNTTKSKTVTVPDLVGTRRTPESAERKLKENGLNIMITGCYSKYVDGNPIAISQSVEPGKEVPEGTVIEVEFRYEGVVG